MELNVQVSGYAQENNPYVRNKLYSNGNIGYADNTPADKHDKHGNRGFSGASQNPGHAVGKCKEKVKKCNHMSLGSTVGNYFWRIIKGSNKIRGEEVNRNTYQLCNGDRAKHPKGSALFRPFVFFSPKVLADESSQSHGKTGNRKEAEAFNFRVESRQPATAICPNLLMLDCTTTFAREIMEFCRPAGSPLLTICRASASPCGYERDRFCIPPGLFKSWTQT